MTNNRSGGPYRITAENLWGWLREARKVEATKEAVVETAVETEGGKTSGMDMETEAEAEAGETETEVEETKNTEMMKLSHWKKVVALVQVDFHEGRLEEEATWQAVILIPKGVGTNC